MNEDGEKEPEFGFQTEDTKGSPVKLHLLFKESVGGMVAAEECDGAVRHSFDERFDVLAVPKRWIHFVVGIKGTDEFVRERNMMRAKFAGHRDPAGSGVSQQTDAAARTEMLAVDPGIAEIGQENISGHDNFLRRPRPAGQTEHRAPVSLVHHTAAHHVVILAMVHDGQIEHPGVLHCAPHHFMVLHAVAIVGDGHDARLGHRSDRSHLFTVQPLGDSAGREHVDQSVFACAIDDPGDGACAIRRRVRVGHADDGSKSAGGCRLGSGLDGFLVGLTRLPQMNVDIDQPRSHHQIPRIDGFAFAGRRLSRNAAIHHIEIGNLIPVGRGVDDPAIFELSGPSSSLSGSGAAQVEDRHAHRESVGDLFKDQALRTIGDFAVDLNPSIDRSGMHDQAARLQSCRSLLGQPEESNIFVHARKIFLTLAFVLNPQQVDHVGRLNDVIDMPGDLHAHFLKGTRDQSARAQPV